MKKLIALTLTIMALLNFSACSKSILGVISNEDTADITYTIKDGVLTVSGSDAIPDYDGCLECDPDTPMPPWNDSAEEITEIVIEEGITGIGYIAFEECINVKKVTLPNSLTYINSEAFNCEMDSLHIPANVKKIEYNPFLSLAEFTVDPSNKYYCSVDGVLFDKEMTTLVCYPQNKRGSNYTLPKSVTKIDDYAFSSNDYIMSVTLPENITHIDEYAFDSRFVGEECKYLSRIHYGGTKEQWSKFNIVTEEDITVECSDGKIHINGRDSERANYQ